MAVFKSVKGVGKNPSSLNKVLDYVGNEREDKGVYKTTGINCSNDPQQAFKDMMFTKNIHDKVNGRQYKHHIQSFKPDEITPEEAHKLAVEFAEKNYKGFDVYIATHQDKDHIHNHYIINSVHRENGMKLNELNKQQEQEKKDKNKELRPHEMTLENLKKSSDDFCKQYGLSIIDKEKKKSLNIYDKKQYMAITKNKGKESYKTQLAITVKKVIENAKNKVDFINKMKDKKIQVIWENTKKNITFKFDDEKKKSIRLSNLAKTYKDPIFEKENFINAIEKNKNNEKSIENIKIKVEKENKPKEIIKNNRFTAEEIIKEVKEKREKKEQLERQKQREKEKNNYNEIPYRRSLGIGR